MRDPRPHRPSHRYARGVCTFDHVHLAAGTFRYVYIHFEHSLGRLLVDIQDRTRPDTTRSITVTSR